MKTQKRMNWLRERIAEQRRWIDRCGGSLAGYIANYGDPGVPPLDKDGNYKTYTIPADKQYLFTDHVRVEGTTDQFYALHSGDGGTLIYQADYDRLKSWEEELQRLEDKHQNK